MSDELLLEIDTPRVTTITSDIAVIGVGGAGGNAVNHMWEQGIRDAAFIICNTDKQALDNSPVEMKICLGEGLGAGNVPEVGRAAAIESLPQIRQQLEQVGVKMVFITAGMGGGTGTGASPVIAKLTREMGILTVAVVTSPLRLEGNLRFKQAMKGIEELRQNVDSLLIVDNENILKIYGRLSLKQAFGKADDILAHATKGIAEIITVKTGFVNVDFKDVYNVMRNSGRAHMAVAKAKGEGRAEAVAEASLKSPLLDDNLISGAKNILLNISVCDSEHLAYNEVLEILHCIQSHASVQDAAGVIHDANIIWGMSEKENLDEEEIELVVVATGFDENRQILFRTDNTGQSVPDMESLTAGGYGAKPVQPQPRMQSSSPRSESVILGAKSSRYKDIDLLLSKPAYQLRNASFVVHNPSASQEEEKK